MCTFLFSASTCLTIKLVITFLVKNAVVIGLFKCKPLAVLSLITFFNAFLECGNGI